MNYQEAVTQLRNKTRRKIANNTYLETREGGAIAVRLHNTDILTFRPGETVFNSGGWLTVTTKERFNRFTPLGRFYSDKGEWFLNVGTWEKPQLYAYQDGLTVHDNGTVSNAAPDNRALHRKWKREAKAYASAYVEALRAGNVAMPSGGDCWGCCMVTDKGETLMGGADHILSHFEERYFVPSLAQRALETFGGSQVERQAMIAGFILGTPEHSQRAEVQASLSNGGASYYGFGFEQLQKHIYRYCIRQLGLAA